MKSDSVLNTHVIVDGLANHFIAACHILHDHCLPDPQGILYMTHDVTSSFFVCSSVFSPYQIKSMARVESSIVGRRLWEITWLPLGKTSC